MASIDDPGEVREGFLCPLCLKDLQSFYQLHSHYEEEHSTEDRDVKGQIKSLVQKAKKAKNKLLKRDGDDRTESGTQGYESFSYGGVDPYMWEPQELGAVRSHLSDFKKHRAARIDHYVVEVNKLIIRLEKLTAFDRTNTEAAKIRAIEKSVVPWVSDQDVPFCPDCGNKFSIRNRRHHCRLCGSIMCKRCMDLIGLPLASKLTSASKEALTSHTSPNQSPNSVHGSRRGSISSVSSVSSVLDEKDDDRIRCCGHCKETLLKREHQIDEKEYIPDIVKFYEKLRYYMETVEQKAPEYIRMAASLNAGETSYSLEHANNLRVEVQKVYELIDALSKKILTLGLNQNPQPHPKALQLQRMIRYSATLFVQEKLLGLMSLPTQKQYEELKEKRKQDMEKRMQMERQGALDSQRRADERQKDLAIRAMANGEEVQTGGNILRKSEGWLPTSSGPRQSEISDPLLQQIDNITSFIKQAKAASRLDEVRMLQENLRQLQDEYDQQQTEKAIELSKRQAEEEDMQREQLQVLREKEWERERQQAEFQPSQTCSEAREIKPFQLETGKDRWNQLEPALDLDAPQLPSPSAIQESIFEAPQQSTRLQQNEVAAWNPFEEQEASKGGEKDPFNPFAEDLSPGASSPGPVLPGRKKEYNPFEDEDEEAANNGIDSASNPFEEGERLPRKPPGPSGPSNPFEKLASTNPFDVDDENGVETELIEEDLLLQQIDNIKAYIFDAKHSGRLDEVEVLTENLKELKRTLAKQKEKDN
ncbi:rabenosyn-5 isoform X1 [Ornithorhynchus anatinus]|uniref:Rabenosyn, RAB effector n=1 Tax=Ornithorhynchus anatinus TaxID=9258 RepID=F6R535_ORNAN|nr:rabenosyn-5 isoform X1 [Ornithorhynchus anatinus]XP_007653572.1 rabenosyn-5 isoform X1 [Ornithorhynchus anatinus]XP_028907887.1 rabenosyn-5 isoform X1 [Ornithorhynchus anatinus]XP_028907888.1 rabenosyn-5 isoform X1 [Ornithorhynchus anatinus]